MPNLYIGLMSGTSMDSVDAVLVNFSEQNPTLLATHCSALPTQLKNDLLSLCQNQQEPLLSQVDTRLAELFSQAVNELLTKSNTSKKDIVAIGSHGQTIFHQPPVAEKNGYSLQIGNPQIIAKLTGITTVGDFRNDDMRVGGQGAPLVPAFHRAVFFHPEKNRVVLNIGGIANITILPKTGAVTGFDTGPGNVLMDHWILTKQNQPFDSEGQWAAKGKTDHALLQQFMKEPYFQLPPPKSTGRELFNATWLQENLLTLDKAIDDKDVQATLCALTAEAISQSILQYASETEEIFVCGGGAYNGTLIKMLQEELAIPITSTADLGIEPEWVEATAFAWLAKQKLEDKPGNLPEVTGADKAVILGKIFIN